MQHPLNMVLCDKNMSEFYQHVTITEGKTEYT
jgi:hypothetical protein